MLPRSTCPASACARGAAEGRALRRWLAAVAAALALGLAVPSGASAWLVDAGGARVPNTDSSSTVAQLVSPPQVVQKLAEPFSPQDDDPDALAQLGPTGAPDDDLGAALDRLASAADPAAAAAARSEALAILTGEDLPERPYSGLPLLNWNAPAKVRRVPAGGTVTVTQVRFPGHVLSDTALLEFEDPGRPFTIAYRIAELGGTAGAELAPAPLLDDGGAPIGGQPAVLTALGLPSFPTETNATSRFHPGGAGEQTRLAVVHVEVRMPPAGMVRAILDPDARPGREAIAALWPVSAERVAELERRFGFAGGSPTAEQRDAAIARLGAAAPERQVFDALRGLDPDDVAGARRAGADLRPLVGVMRTRTELPPGIAPDPGADVTVALLNDEAYVSRTDVRVADGRPLRVEIVNGDGFHRIPSALQLRGRIPVFGALDWGRFDWGALDLGGTLAPGARRTVTVDAAGDAFALWVGDAMAGDQAGAVVRVQRGARLQSLSVAGPPDDPRPSAAPVAAAEDPQGDVWAALAGVDELVRVRPVGELGQAVRETVVLPGGAHGPLSGGRRLAPHAVAVDGRGVVWSTLRLGNAIARVDPARVRDGTSEGVRVYPLPACGAGECAVPLPPDPPVGTRAPAQLAVTEDAEGNTVAWFAERGADTIGALRVAPDGTQLGRVDFPCGCRVPAGVALDGDGNVWFGEAVSNRIGRLTQDPTRPWSTAGARLEHFEIPSSAHVEDPALASGPTRTSAPHSLAVDRLGRIWFTESATGKVALLDPERARPDTSEGIRELTLPRDDFGGPSLPGDLTVDRAGTAFWVDRHGDGLGAVTADGSGGSLRAGARWRPAERQSLSAGTMVDGRGDLWFAESASALLSRIEGVSAGRPRPARTARLELATAAGTLAGSGLREMDAVDVRVERAGAIVAAAEAVDVHDGMFALGGRGRAWSRGPDGGLLAGDAVTLTPRGTHAPAPVAFRVPALTASVGADGRVTGSATLGGAALPGRVELAVGGASATAAVDPADGAFAAMLIPAAPAGARGAVAWTGATPAAVVTTVTSFGEVDPGAGGGGGGAGGGGASSGGGANGGGASSGGGANGTGASSSGGANRTGASSSGGAHGGYPSGARTRACAPVWLTRRATTPRRSLPLLAASGRALQRCLGRPAARARSAAGERWTYRGGLALRVRDGRVRGFALTGARWLSRPDRAGVGSGRVRLERALGRLSGRGSKLRTVLRLARGRLADVRVTLVRGRATRIAVDLRTRAQLDRSGRALARRAR